MSGDPSPLVTAPVHFLTLSGATANAATKGETMTTCAEARQFLLDHRTDYAGACAGFRWPEPVPFNWALDWFERVAAAPESRDRPALWIVEPAAGTETRVSF